MAEKEWFKEWFDSPYYHILYAHRNHEEAEDFIAKISAYLAISPGSKILDVACGKGRHSQKLAEAGFDVTGIDLSKNSIEEAKKHQTDNLHFEVWDMRQVYRPEAFDYVFNLFSSFGYFDNEADDYAAINAMYANLKPGGKLVFDYINTEAIVKKIKPREIIQKGDIQFHIQKRIEKGFIKKQIDFLANGENHHYNEQLKMINQYRFEEMLGSAGFTVLEHFGDYDMHPFNPANSPRLIITAEKR